MAETRKPKCGCKRVECDMCYPNATFEDILAHDPVCRDELVCGARFRCRRPAGHKGKHHVRVMGEASYPVAYGISERRLAQFVLEWSRSRKVPKPPTKTERAAMVRRITRKAHV